MSEAIVNSYLHAPVPNKVSSQPQSQSRSQYKDTLSHTNNTTITYIDNHINGISQKSTDPIPYVKFIFPDIRAIYQLNKANPFHGIVYNEVTIHGFELYLVENWVAQRGLSSIITSFTGNSQDIIHGIEMVLPADYEHWPPVLKKYYDELITFSQPKFNDKLQCILFITNLSTLPLSLHILHIENGDLRSVWLTFKINFNLKSMNCLGRSSNLLMEPSNSSIEKFNHLFKISASNPSSKFNSGYSTNNNHNGALKNCSGNLENWSYYAITDIIQTVQIALHYFNSYNHAQDGLLCDFTKAAINNWWVDYGKLYFGMEGPRNETVLNPTTYAAIISLTFAVYYKLILENCTNSKHPFHNIDEYFLAISLFQKKINYSRRDGKVYLDHITLEKLFEATAKYNTNKDLLHLKRKMKSKMQDLTGKSNTARLSHEILTTDLDNLISNLHDSDNDLTYLWKPSHSNKFISLSTNIRDFTQYNFHHGDTDKELKLRTQLLDNSKKASFTEPFKRYRSHFSVHNFVESRYASDVTNRPTLDMSPSFMSISSMFPMYDNPSDNFDDQYNNENYQEEYFRRNSLPFINDGTRDTDECACKNIFIYRSNSQSNIAESIERWDLPFDPSIVKLARDLKRIDLKLLKQEQSENEEQICSEDKICESNLAKFNALTEDIQKEIDRYKENSGYFQTQFLALKNKQNLAYNDVSEITLLSAKLNYDMRILELRVRDVEDSIKQFDTKLCQVKKLLIGLDNDDKEFCKAMSCIDDKSQFDSCIKKLVELENKSTCYKSICSSILKKCFLLDLKKDIMGWVDYFFAHT